ncbi:MAG: DUF2007 domain-containing protein [Actinomycetota bacterium]
MSTTLDRPPPPVAGRGGGGGRDWVELFRARDDIDAHLLVGRLEEAAIETRCVKDRREPGAWLYGGSNPWAPVTIYVRRHQLVDARMLLAELSLEVSGRPRARPEPAGRRRSVVWWIAALLLGLLLTGAALMQVGRGLERCDLPVVCRSE